ncbi:MAG: YraN family protein [Clostridia bacterium]|nr:YraN family protein [Clostridia bacterium]
MEQNNLTGQWGETVAAQYLRKRKWEILACNYRCRFGEIDLICKNKEFIVFVEVKTRKSAEFAQAMEYVDARKQQRIIATAQMYLAQNETELQPRFDVIEVYGSESRPEEKPKLMHMENAFSADQGAIR